MARRILVVGQNCQVAVLAGCLQFLAPDARVEAVEPANFSDRDSNPERLLEAVAGADLVACFPLDARALGGVTPARIAETARACAAVPSIVFPAFHPDIVNVARDGRHYASPMGDYHSALIVYGFARGYGPDEILSLFRPEVFSRVGYLDGWFAARDSLLGTARRHGCDLDRLFSGWMRRGCFMHTVNHPKLFVLADLARDVLARGRIPARAASCEDYLPDPLGGTVWPVYPEIAARMGVAGGTTFKPPLGGSDFLADAARCIGLRAMVEGSLAMYAQSPGIAEDCGRVSGWIKNPRIRETLRPVAA